MAETMPCGTVAAHRRHYYYGEEPCDPCKEAARKYARDNKKPKTEPQLLAHRAHSKRRQAAVRALIAMYPADFQRLLTQQQENFR